MAKIILPDNRMIHIDPRNVNPTLLEFDQPEEKGINLLENVQQLARANTHLILAFPGGSIAPITSDITNSNGGIRLSGAVEYRMKSIKRDMEAGLISKGGVEFYENDEAQRRGFRMMLFFYNKFLIGDYGFMEPNYDQLINDMTRAQRRKMGKSNDNKGFIDRVTAFFKPKHPTDVLRTRYFYDLGNHLYIQKYGEHPPL